MERLQKKIGQRMMLEEQNFFQSSKNRLRMLQIPTMWYFWILATKILQELPKYFRMSKPSMLGETEA